MRRLTRSIESAALYYVYIFFSLRSSVVFFFFFMSSVSFRQDSRKLQLFVAAFAVKLRLHIGIGRSAPPTAAQRPPFGPGKRQARHSIFSAHGFCHLNLNFCSLAAGPPPLLPKPRGGKDQISTRPLHFRRVGPPGW